MLNTILPRTHFPKNIGRKKVVFHEEPFLNPPEVGVTGRRMIVTC